MKIAIATFADLPSPPVKGGAVETLIDIICQINEKKKKIDIDLVLRIKMQKLKLQSIIRQSLCTIRSTTQKKLM